MTRPIAISDSANFYVSAERIFNPTLKNVPVIVLSNNDGCAVARSDEAKALGIKMGEPLHLIRDKVEAHGIRVFSSNYTLYGDISRRVVEVYEDYEQRPLTLFDTYREGSPALMQALDEVNGRFGKKTMVLASEGVSRSWQLRQITAVRAIPRG